MNSIIVYTQIVYTQNDKDCVSKIMIKIGQATKRSRGDSIIFVYFEYIIL